MNCEATPETRRVQLEAANNRLSLAIEAIVEVTGLVVDSPILPVTQRGSLRHRAGTGIRALVQDHLSANLVGETSVRGHRLLVDVGSNISLDLDRGELYRDPSRYERSRDRWPVPPQEWYAHWRPILEQVTSPKYY